MEPSKIWRKLPSILAAVEPPDDAGEAESEAEAAELDFLLFFVEPVLAEASAAGALGFDASAAGGAVASLDALSDFLLRFDFLAGEASAAVAELSVAAASVSDFFFRFDFLVVEASAVAAEVSAAAASASAFLLFFDFFGVGSVCCRGRTIRRICVRLLALLR